MANFLKNLFDKKKVERVDIARRFELLARVGQGSMSKVWRARDFMTGRMLAIKVLDPAKTARFESRFKGLNKPSEGEVAVSLQHPNIVKTIEFGTTTDDEPYLMMEFVEGLSLSYLVDTQNEQMQDNCLNYIIQLGEAIDYLHKQNWIHRDLCPRNVMVNSDNNVKLIDFGLVVPNTLDFQRPGNRTGTANYMAPELIKRQRTDQRIDIFSFAVTAYEMYTKRLPWDVPDQQTLDTVLQHINQPPTAITDFVPNIDSRVAEVIMKGLMTIPDERWQSMAEMLIPLRKAHEEIEAKKALERRMKAAAAKAKSKDKDNAASAAQAKKKAEDDAFFEQLISGDTPERSDPPKAKSMEAPARSEPKSNSIESSPAEPSSRSADKAAPSSSKNSSGKPPQKKSSKPAAPKPLAKPVVVEDEFDGIEIEEEGFKLEAIKAQAEASEEPGRIKADGEANATRPGSARKFSGNQTASQNSDQKISEDDDDEPVLRLPDDD